MGTAAANYSGAATTSDIVSLKNYKRVAVLIQCGAWAGGTAAVTLKQCQDVSATGVKALEFDFQYTNAVSTATPVLTPTAVTSDTFNLSAANARHVIEIDSSNFDIANGFDCLRVDIASPGANADIYGVEFIMYDGTYADSTMPSPIAD